MLQHVTASVHLIGIIVAVLIVWKLPDWTHFGYMLAASNIIGAAFYISVFYFPEIDNHILSQYRTLALALVWTTFALGLLWDGRDAK